MSLQNRWFYRSSLIGIISSALFLSSFSYGASKEHTLLIGGTGSALGGIQLLATEFNKLNTNIQVEVLSSLGSGGGIKALIRNAIDIAVSARLPTTKEIDKGVIANLYAKTPMVLATSSQTEVENLTLSELESFYDKPQQLWSNGIPVRLVLRPRSETDIKILRKLSKGMNDAVDSAYSKKGLLIAINDQKNASLLEDLPGSIGISTLGQIKSEKRRLKVVALDGVRPSLDLVERSEYLLIKSLYLIYSKEVSSKNQKFIDYLRSDAGATILRNNGYLPML